MQTLDQNLNKKNFPVLGLTGGMASGKTTAANYMLKKGAAIIDADQIARDLVRPGTEVYKKIITEFQEDFKINITHANGELNRLILNKRLFSDPKFRLKFEGLLHPPILERILQDIKTFLVKPHPREALLILCAPLLFEAGLHKLCQNTLVISCNDENQITRLMKRDGYTAEEARLRIQSQMSLEEKRKKATWVIDNDASVRELYQNIDALWPTVQAFTERE